MKLILVGHPDEDIRSTLELILKNWGYRVMAAVSTKHLLAFLEETEPDLLMLGAKTLATLDSNGIALVEKRRLGSEAGLFTLNRKDDPAFPEGIDADIHLDVPLDIFDLFAAVQNQLEKHPRSFLRMDVKLPGMVSKEGKSSYLGEVLSLSPRGLFIKIGCRLEKGQTIQTIIPLIGIHKELDIEGKVLYTVQPAPENNYMQGAGIEFTGLSEENMAVLEGYLESRFISGIRNLDEAGTMLASDQIQFHHREITIKLLRKNH
ncbi:MAG TPA: PilZ domain-containing protein [Desulfuromonadales bacterium]|nr:PilZ domain-containing protein [Desulfuromonadales bacterium]